MNKRLLLFWWRTQNTDIYKRGSKKSHETFRPPTTTSTCCSSHRCRLYKSTPAHETPSKISSHTVQPGLRIIIYFAREIGIESSPLEHLDHLHKGLFYMLAADIHTESSEICLLLLWVWWPEVLK
ncbi:hypothetical protein LINPERHAP1_LOCUS40635 [Linum perenne]